MTAGFAHLLRGRRASLGVFFSLTFALTWTAWIAAVQVVGESGSGGAFRSAVTTLLVVLGIVAPAIVAEL